jgi:hypothetical protein
VKTTNGPGDDPAGDWGGRAMRAGFILAILFLAAFYTYVAFAELSYLSSAGRLGPGFFPRIIGVSLLALCALSLYGESKGGSHADAVAPAWRSAAVLALLTGIFVALLEVLGGLLSMILFMGVSLSLLNRGRLLQNALVAVLLPLAIYVVFELWLKAAMPRGMLPLPF